MSATYAVTDLQRRKMLFALEEKYQELLPLAKGNLGLAVIRLRYAYSEVWRVNCPNEFRACQRLGSKCK
jgi:hypothetical protein